MKVARIFALATVTIQLAATIARGQTTAPPDCSVSGWTLNSLTGGPIPRARVVLAGGSGGSRTVDTDATGAWSFVHTGCGRMTVSATRPTFLPENPGQLTSVLPAPGVPLHDVKIQLAPQAVVTGQVLDDQGDPIQGAAVMAMTSRVFAGTRRVGGGAIAVTNDIGEYRIAGLSAGKYIFCARTSGFGSALRRDTRAFAEQCSPGPVDAASASAMYIRAGYNGIVDFRLAPLSLRHVRGAIAGAPEGARPLITLDQGANALGAPMGADGNFDIENVIPGLHMLSATVFEGSERLAASLPVTVGDADVEGIQLHLETGVNVAGTVRIASASGKAIDNPQYAASLTPSGSTPTVWSEDKTTFTLTNVIPGRYRLRFTAPAPFYLKSARLDGQDIADSEVSIVPGTGTIDVVLSDDSGVLEGVVSPDGTSPASIVVLGEKERQWIAQAGADGHFRIDAIPPGDYQVYAWNDVTNVEYANPEWMHLNAKGTAVTVDPGQTATVKVVTQVAPEE